MRPTLIKECEKVNLGMEQNWKQAAIMIGRTSIPIWTPKNELNFLYED
jgi:hypothetical protein